MMRLKTLFILLAAICQLTMAMPAHAMVLQDEPAPEGRPRVGVLIVAANVFIDKWARDNLGDSVVVADAEAKRLGDASRGGPDYVEVLTGTEATVSGVRGALKRLKNEQLTHVYVFIRSFGLGGDTGEPCLILADWSSDNASGSCFSGQELSDLVDAVAEHPLLVLDASVESLPFREKFGVASLGPNAFNWPNREVPVISSAGDREFMNCAALFPMFTEIMDGLKPGMTLGELDQKINGLASKYEAGCNGARFRPRFEGKGWKPSDPFFPAPAATVAITPPPVITTVVEQTIPVQKLPEAPTLPIKTRSKFGLDSWLLAGATAVLGTTCGVAEPWLLQNLAETETQADIQANFNSQQELDAHRAITPVLGYTATVSCAATGVALTATILTGAF